MGDFEYALVYYHRGSKLRPDLTEFTLGIHKAQEAINNSIGSKLAGVNIHVNHNSFIFSTRAVSFGEDRGSHLVPAAG